MTGQFLPQRYCSISLFSDSSVGLLLLKTLYNVHREDVVATVQRITFSDAMFKMFKTFSLKTLPRIEPLGAFKRSIVFPDSVRHGCRGDPVEKC